MAKVKAKKSAKKSRKVKASEPTPLERAFMACDDLSRALCDLRDAAETASDLSSGFDNDDF